ncbi:hypothetical protein [Mucilaginibacter sp. dw_454]|uniref:hypothetical protein n=1 Tax=Mucilaginibacter sp. dw_454 TaxID=2720079 RepID=UPI001BD2F5FA|nr:hypothetical protein [Mucilaginibacter sp. dw_454]
MLKDGFFLFTHSQTEGDIVKYDIKLNAEHSIFEGHFPAQPILPGVCMMQMVKEVVETHINKPTQLLKANDLKFLAFIRPDQDKLIQMDLEIKMEEEKIIVKASLLDEATTFFKFKGIFVQEL